MKKQKMPVFLVLAVVALLGYVGYQGLPKTPQTPPNQQPQEDKSTDVAKDVAQNLDAKPKDPKEATKTGPKGQNRPVVSSSLLKVDQSTFKPKPNPSSTASQWYKPGAGGGDSAN